MPSYAPGPWTLGRFVSRGDPARVIEAGGRKIATANTDNAQAIAALPDALDALFAARRELSCYVKGDTGETISGVANVLEEIDAALKKAGVL